MARPGIIGWGAYIPRYRLPSTETASLWGYPGAVPARLGVPEKSVAGPDEDSVTMAVEAARNALRRAGIPASRIGAVFVGSESKPYAVKPSATIIAEAIGAAPDTMASDLEFACRAGSEGLRAALGLVEAGHIQYGLAIGSDTAQASPGDVLDFTAASGAAAYIVGPYNEAAAVLEGAYTYVTDTPDFWRRDGSPYPLHGESFTGEPAYFHHIVSAVKALMEKLGLKPSDIDYAVFHQPNASFPLRAARKLGIPAEKVKPGLVVTHIGNTYNASALLGLAKVLEEAQPGSRILVAPFGSGAGADAYTFIVTDLAPEKRSKAPRVADYIARRKTITYAEYAKYRKLYRRAEW